MSPTPSFGKFEVLLNLPSPLPSIYNQTPNSAILIPISDLNASASYLPHCHTIFSMSCAPCHYPLPSPTSALHCCLKCNPKKINFLLKNF